MESLNIQAELSWNLNLSHSATARHHLSSTTRYCICKLLRHINEQEPPELLAFKDRIGLDAADSLDKLLQEKYPTAIELNQVISQLDYLAHLYTELTLQSTRHSASSLQMIPIRQQVLQLLGFQEGEPSPLSFS